MNWAATIGRAFFGERIAQNPKPLARARLDQRRHEKSIDRRVLKRRAIGVVLLGVCAHRLPKLGRIVVGRRRAERNASRLRAGNVHLNGAGPDFNAPFGSVTRPIDTTPSAVSVSAAVGLDSSHVVAANIGDDGPDDDLI